MASSAHSAFGLRALAYRATYAVLEISRPLVSTLKLITLIGMFPTTSPKVGNIIDIRRVLLFSSFTPFIVIFLHAIAATSSDDIQLLNEVVESLQHIRYVSPSSERLYQICSTFLQIARELVKTRQSCVGAYNQLEDSLQFATDAGPMSIFEPDCLQSLFGTDTSEYAPFLADHDMCAIFDSWATGVPAGVNLFGGDVGGI